MQRTGRTNNIKAETAGAVQTCRDARPLARHDPPRSDVLLVNLPQITVLSGVLAFETLHRYGDLVLGDTYCFRHCTSMTQAQVLDHTTLLLNDTPHVGPGRFRLGSYRHIILMSHTGRRVDAAVLRAQIGMTHHFVALPQSVDLSPDYDLIECGPDHAASVTLTS